MWGFWVDDQMVSRLPARLVVRHHAARLDGARRQPLVHHPLGDHHVRRREGRVDGGFVDRPLATDAGAGRQRAEGDVVREVGVQHRRLAGHRGLRIDHRRQRLAVDLDGVGGVPRHVAVAGHDNRDRIADEADGVHRHRVVFGRRERRTDRHRCEKLGDLRPGEDRLHPFQRLGGAGVDGPDPAVRDVAALEREVLHAGDLHVVDVGAAALDQARVLAALDALADELR